MSSRAITCLVWTAGMLHFVQVPVMIVMSRLLDWPAALAALCPANRAIVRTVMLAIVLVLTGLGVVVVVAPGGLCNGDPLGTALAAFLAALFGYRSYVQLGVYARHWPGGRAARALHRGLAGMFTLQAGVYLLAFLRGLLTRER